MRGGKAVKLTSAMILSSRGVTVISCTNKRYEPEQLNAKELGPESAVFDTSAGISEEEMRGNWGFIVPRSE